MSFIYTKYIITCEEIVEEKDGSLTFIKVFDRRNLKEFPAKINFFLVLAIEYSLTKKEDRDIKISFVGPNEDDLENEIEFTLRETKKNHGMLSLNKIKLSGVPLKDEGSLSVLVQHKEKIIARQDIIVQQEVGE
jgi:hypothetical protein